MQKEGCLFSIVKGVGIALFTALVLSLLFAVILRFGGLSEKAIYPVNQGVKVLAVALGALLFVRGERGWLQGLAIGVLFTLLSYLAFSAIGGDFSLSWLILSELLIGGISGLLGGSIAVNLRR